MTDIHLVLPAGYDDPRRPSGGNEFDLRLCAGLSALGWRVVLHEVADAWPMANGAAAGIVERELALIPPDRVVVVDGLLSGAAAEAISQHAGRLRLVVLAHMPGPPGGPPAAVLRASQLVITTSGWTSQTLIDQYAVPADKLLVAPPGAPPAELAAGTSAGGALLCVAAVMQSKGHDVLFAALADLAAQPWTCVCVGALDREPGFVRQQRRVLAAAGIADRVQLSGPLAGADLERAYAAADVLVLPTRLESYGIVVVEALARGLPVIATSVGGVGEAMGHAADGRRPGIMVEPDDHRALGRGLAAWLTDPELRADLRCAARSRRALLTGWDQTVTTVSSALRRLASG